MWNPRKIMESGQRLSCFNLNIPLIILKPYRLKSDKEKLLEKNFEDSINFFKKNSSCISFNKSFYIARIFSLQIIFNTFYFNSITAFTFSYSNIEPKEVVFKHTTKYIQNIVNNISIFSSQSMWIIFLKRII